MERQVWRAHYTPKLKKRTALLRKLKDVFRRYQSQPVDRVVQLINPVLRGWVNYFAVGHSSECFSFIKDWVEKRIRRHMGDPGTDAASAGKGGVGTGCTRT
jgi:RNA-directed DNA polymerase